MCDGQVLTSSSIRSGAPLALEAGFRVRCASADRGTLGFVRGRVKRGPECLSNGASRSIHRTLAFTGLPTEGVTVQGLTVKIRRSTGHEHRPTV